MTEESIAARFGKATIDPPGAIAGQHGTWRLTYQAGSEGVAVGGSIRIYTDSDTDWEPPQFVDPSAADFMSISAPDGVNVAARIENQRSLRVFIHGRGLNAGEKIQLTFGDTSGGGPGSRTQTFVESQHFFWIDVDAGGNGEPVTLPDPPHLAIVGDEPVRFVVVAPSTIVVGEPFRVLVKVEDQWGNPVESYGGSMRLEGDGIEVAPQDRQVDFSDEHIGAKWLDGFVARRSGTLSLSALDDALGIGGNSNPILAADVRPEYELHWADAHGGQLVLNSKIKDFFRYARDVAGVQFVGYQRNADVISEEDWQVQQREERAFYEPGRFVAIPGFEWSGRTWEGGHHNVYFRRHDQPARRNRPAEDMFQGERAETELKHILDVYRAYRGSDVMLTPHVGGEHSDLTHHDPTLEPAVEMVSSHGMFEWMQRDALARGYRLGFLGGSDSYTCRPGDDRPGFQMRRYSKAGITGIYVKDVSLESFFEAMRARRVYATTGARMILCTEADGHCMGSECSTSNPPTIRGSVVGTAPLESVELFRGLDCIHAVPIETQTTKHRVRLLWRGSSRMTSYSGIVWDGTLRVNGAKIENVETLRFDSPRSRILNQDADCVRWQAWGCGYPMGLLIDLDNANNAVLEIAVGTQTITGPAYGGHGSRAPRRISFAPAENATMRVSARELAEQGRQQLEIGVLERRLEISLAEASSTSSIEFQHTDESPCAGVNPYWIRVVQTDLEMGWTSPVFVDFCPTIDEAARAGS